MEYYNKNLESLLADYNSSIRLLNTYLQKGLDEITNDTTLGDINTLKDIIDKTEEMNLNHNSTFYVCCNEITTVKKACNHRGFNGHCDEIEKIWRNCKSKYCEIVDVIDAMKRSINALQTIDDFNNKSISQLVSISNSSSGVNYDRISLEKVDEIYKRTTKDCFDKSFWKSNCFFKVFISVIIAFLLILCFAGCSQNDNRISISSEKANYTISLCQTLDTIIEGETTISYNGRDTITIRLFCFDNSTIKLDTIFELSDKREFLIPDATRQQIVVIPKSNVCTFNTKIVRTGFSSAEHLYKCIKICLILIALVLIVLITKPLFIKLIDNRIIMDEKILNNNLKNWNDWQDIIQAYDRLQIKREEMGINIQEKRQRAEIDENENRANHNRNMERTRSEQDLERYRIDMKRQTDYDQRTLINLNNVNEQLSQIINSLISNQ